MTTVLTIAGYDPSSGAGVTADLMVFAAHGLFGTSAITALTVQSTVGVQSTHPVEACVLRATLECLEADLPPAGIKIGMLATAANVEAVSNYVEVLRAREHRHRVPIVLDPVLRSSSGRELLDADGLDALRRRLIPLVDWITPNIDELSVLTGTAVRRRQDLPDAARLVQEMSGSAVPGVRLGVFATGGHLDPPDDLLLTATGEQTWLAGERVQTRATHGTGCALSSAFLALLVIGRSAPEAALEAKRYVAEAMRSATPTGSGASGINHLWALSNRSV